MGSENPKSIKKINDFTKPSIKNPTLGHLCTFRQTPMSDIAYIGYGTSYCCGVHFFEVRQVETQKALGYDAVLLLNISGTAHRRAKNTTIHENDIYPRHRRRRRETRRGAFNEGTSARYELSGAFTFSLSRSESQRGPPCKTHFS